MEMNHHHCLKGKRPFHNTTMKSPQFHPIPRPTTTTTTMTTTSRSRSRRRCPEPQSPAHAKRPSLSLVRFWTALWLLSTTSILTVGLFPTTTTTAYVISAHHAVPARRQMEFLKQMTYDFTHADHLSPDQVNGASRLLSAWSQPSSRSSGTPSQTTTMTLGVEKALALESLIKRWIDEIKDQEEQSQSQQSDSPAAWLHPPTVEDYNCLLEGWARSGAGTAAAERCEQILHAMQNQPHCRPNLSSYKAVLMAWRLAVVDENHNNNNKQPPANDNNNPNGHHAALRAQRILEGMIRDCSTATNSAAAVSSSSSVTTTHSNKKKNKKHHNKRSKRSHHQHHHPNNDSNKQSTTIDHHKPNIIYPDADCFDICLQTWSRCAATYAPAPHHAEAVLALMERLYEETGRTQVRPRTTSFNALLATWARCTVQPAPLCAQRALDLLNFMQVLEEEQQQQQQQQQQGDGDTNNNNSNKKRLGALSTVAPDNASYCTVMGALSRANHGNPLMIAEQAEELLQRVEERYRQAASADQQTATIARSTIVPDTILYNTAMGCWAKTFQPGSYRRARSILDRQLRLSRDLKSDHGIAAHNLKAASNLRNYQPDVFGFTSVIASCAAETKEKDRAFNVALSTFLQMEEQFGIAPNHVTYGNMLKAVARLLPTEAQRKRWAHKVFVQACEAGCVGDMVLSRTREAHPETFVHLMQGRSKRDLPSEWTRNLPQRNVRDERKHRLTRNLTWQQQQQQTPKQQDSQQQPKKQQNHNQRQQQRNEYHRKKNRSKAMKQHKTNRSSKSRSSSSSSPKQQATIYRKVAEV
mmetsp:Transcript_17728/g.38628  ORF Transcript_17728/g.38628 Transcript_17728/m.38628 type:complete len:810 (+) Transcript_17728:122-2551(+)